MRRSTTSTSRRTRPKRTSGCAARSSPTTTAIIAATRNGYDAPALAALLNAKPGDVRDFLAGTLASDRAREFTELLRVAGVPL